MVTKDKRTGNQMAYEKSYHNEREREAYSKGYIEATIQYRNALEQAIIVINDAIEKYEDDNKTWVAGLRSAKIAVCRAIAEIGKERKTEWEKIWIENEKP